MFSLPKLQTIPLADSTIVLVEPSAALKVALAALWRSRPDTDELNGNLDAILTLLTLYYPSEDGMLLSCLPVICQQYTQEVVQKKPLTDSNVTVETTKLTLPEFSLLDSTSEVVSSLNWQEFTAIRNWFMEQTPDRFMTLCRDTWSAAGWWKMGTPVAGN
jgi:hypothetical protein